MKEKGTDWIEATPLNRNSLAVRVVPNARKTEIAGYVDGVVRVRLRAPALEGRANEELICLLAKVFGTRRSQVVLVRGAKSREKRFQIQGWEGNGESAGVWVARWAQRTAGPRGKSQ
ncbi:MAG: DUF167 domain-containing protein [Candidatus Methylacidiphilaceae bacterium]